MKRAFSILLATAMVFVLIAAPVYAVRTRSTDGYNVIENKYLNIANGDVRCHVYSDYYEESAFAEMYLSLRVPKETTMRAEARVTVFYTDGTSSTQYDEDENISATPVDGAAAYPEVFYKGLTPDYIMYEHRGYVNGILEYDSRYSVDYDPS